VNLALLFVLLAAIAAAFFVVPADLRRRRLVLTRATGGRPLTFLDVTAAPLAGSTVGAFLATLIRVAIFDAVVPLHSPLTFAVLVSTAAFFFLWLISVVMLPTPRGLVLAQKRDGRN
jgi:hypothetical protein